MTDADDVARWMASQVESMGFLHQKSALAHIVDHFGDEFVSTDEHGHSTISKPVMDAFHRLTSGIVIWDRWDKCWRHRDLGYPPGPRGPHEKPIG